MIVPTQTHDVIAALLGGATGAFVGHKVMPKPIIDTDLIPFLPSKAMTVQHYNKYPGAYLGAVIGALGAFLIARHMKKRALASLAQAQPTNSGTVDVAVTWANGHTETLSSDDVVPGEHLMQYISDGVIDVAENQFGESASKMFPATIDVIHADEFYRGVVVIDPEGFPELSLENTSVKRPDFLAKGADRRNAKRENAARSAINQINAGKQKVGHGVSPNDFTMPIPTRRG